MNAEFVQELQTELDRLSQYVQSAQARQTEPNEIQQHTNSFEIQWQERLTIEQRAETRGAKTGVEQAFEERHNQDRTQADMRDAARLRGMTPEDQVAYWNSNRTGSGFTQEAQRAQEVSQVVTQTQKQISSEYNELRYGLVKAVAEIEEGRRPNLTQLLGEVVKQDTAPERAQEPSAPSEQMPQALVANATRWKEPESFEQYQTRLVQQGIDPEQSARDLARERDREQERERKIER